MFIERLLWQNENLHFSSTVKTVIFLQTVCDVLFHLRQAMKSDSFSTMYHASLNDETKEQVFTTFSSSDSQLRCIVSTVAWHGKVSTT